MKRHLCVFSKLCLSLQHVQDLAKATSYDYELKRRAEKVGQGVFLLCRLLTRSRLRLTVGRVIFD